MMPNDSAEHIDIEMDRFSLSFIGDTEIREQDFLDDYFEKSSKRIRSSLWLGLFIYAGFGFLDVIMSPDRLMKLWFIRYFLVCPIIAIGILFSYSRHFRSYMQITLSLITILAAAGLVMMMIVDPVLPNSYFAGLILVYMFSYTFLRLRFVYASVSGLIIVMIYEIGSILFTETSTKYLINNSFDIVSANIIGMFACYFMEKYERRNYIITHQIRKRTIELDKANKRLTTSINEQKQQAFELSILNEMGNHLNRHATERETYDEMAKTCEKLFPGDSGHMYILNNTGTKLEKVADWGDAIESPELLDTYACSCYQTGSEKYCGKPVHDPHCPHQASAVCHGHSCVPILIRGETIGALHIGFNRSENMADEEWLEIIESKRSLFVRMAKQYAPFLGNLRLRIIDPLTGLRNRIYVTEILEWEVQDAKRFGIVYFDIDKFREINKKYGNEAGDVLLKQMGEFLKERIGGDDIPCRYGGGEFMIVAPELSPSEAAYQAEQLRKAITTDLKTMHNENEFKITVSFGVAGKPDHGATVKEVVSAAEQALRRAKASGKNRIVVI